MQDDVDVYLNMSARVRRSARRTFRPRQSERLITQRLGQDLESNVPVPKREPSKDHVEHVVEQLNVQPSLAHERMTGAVKVAKVDDRMDGSEEGPVQPSSTLRDEFGKLDKQSLASLE